MNDAAIQLCLADVSLVEGRGDLLKCRKKVSDDWYVYKGHSRSKVYGVSHSASTPKRPKCDKNLREQRLQAIEDEMKDKDRMLQFKEKRSQAETGRNYKACEGDYVPQK